MKKLAFIAVSSLMVLTGCTPGAAKGLPMTRAEAVQKVRTFGNNTGYLITYDLADAENGEFEVQTGMKDEISWTVRNGTDGIALQHQEDLYHLFVLTGNGPEYEGSYDRDVYETWYTAGNLMFQAYDMDATYAKGDEVTILDRACTYHSFQFTLLESYTYDYKVALDNELGIALEIKCTSADATKGDQITFKAKSFLTGDDVVAPKLPVVDNPIIINDNQPDLTKKELPNKLHIDIKQGQYMTGYVEVVDGQMLIGYQWEGSFNYKYFAYKNADGMQLFEKDVDGELGWVDYIIGEMQLNDLFDVLAALAGRIGSCYTNLFDVTILDRATKMGNAMVNGNRTTVYKTNDAKCYLSNEYKMFLKIEYDENSDWNFEVTNYYAIEELSDTAIF